MMAYGMKYSFWVISKMLKLATRDVLWLLLYTFFHNVYISRGYSLGVMLILSFYLNHIRIDLLIESIDQLILWKDERHRSSS
jgi:hypothetical protein